MFNDCVFIFKVTNLYITRCMTNYLKLSERTLVSCRICLENDNEYKLISPCRCSGSMKYVHHKCLCSWMEETTNNDSRIKCEICNYEYKKQLIETDPCFKYCAVNGESFFIVSNFIIFLLIAAIQLIDTSNIIVTYINPNVADQDSIMKYISLYSFCSLSFICIIWIYVFSGVFCLKSKEKYLGLYRDRSCSLKLLTIIVITVFLMKQWVASSVINNWYLFTINDIHLKSLRRILPEEIILEYNPDNIEIEV